MLIDWVNAGSGNPMYDIAEYIWLNTPREDINFEGIPQELINFYLQNKELIIPTFISEYEKISGKDITSYEFYIIPLLAKKLNSNRTDEEKRKIVLEIRERLNLLQIEEE